jgi:hypothetical protein
MDEMEYGEEEEAEMEMDMEMEGAVQYNPLRNKQY